MQRSVCCLYGRDFTVMKRVTSGSPPTNPPQPLTAFPYEARLGSAPSMHGSAQPGDRFPPASSSGAMAGSDSTPGLPSAIPPSAMRSAGDRSSGNRTLAETELDSALQLLMERTQYITGATGAALALPQGEEMVCRASAGASAPAVGARLQVRSGLTGESVSRRQLLRCDNAETDPRVNLETCRAVGIASIVVLPLLRRTGEVRGLVELFSDHPYAFEERDLIALERMAELTLTALDLAEQRQHSAPPAVTPRELEKPDPILRQRAQKIFRRSRSHPPLLSRSLRSFLSSLPWFRRQFRRRCLRLSRQSQRRPLRFPRRCCGCRSVLRADSRFLKDEPSVSIAKRKVTTRRKSARGSRPTRNPLNRNSNRHLVQPSKTCHSTRFLTPVRLLLSPGPTSLCLPFSPTRRPSKNRGSPTT